MSGTGQPGRQLELIRAARESSIPVIEEVNPDAAVVPVPGPASVVASVVGAAGGAAVVAVDGAARLSGIGATEIGDTCDGVDVAAPGGGAAVVELAVVALSDVAALAEDDVTSDELATSDPPVEHAAKTAAAYNAASTPGRPLPPRMPPPWHSRRQLRGPDRD